MFVVVLRCRFVAATPVNVPAPAGPVYRRCTYVGPKTWTLLSVGILDGCRSQPREGSEDRPLDLGDLSVLHGIHQGVLNGGASVSEISGHGFTPQESALRRPKSHIRSQLVIVSSKDIDIILQDLTGEVPTTHDGVPPRSSLPESPCRQDSRGFVRVAVQDPVLIGDGHVEVPAVGRYPLGTEARPPRLYESELLPKKGLAAAQAQRTAADDLGMVREKSGRGKASHVQSQEGHQYCGELSTVDGSVDARHDATKSGDRP